jgi:FAD/FMN-containing dehydrogenase
MSKPLPPDFLTHLGEQLPQDAVSVEPGDLQAFGKDWTKVHTPAPSVVVFPRTTDEVSRVLKLCNAARVAVVPSGGRTGLAGGAVATNGELVLSLTRMSRMEPVDVLGMSVVVQAGAVTEAVHRHAAQHGLTWPVDFASKGSSHVGGNIATNAGGVRVIRYGLTRQWVLGLQVVTAAGDVLELGGALEKNNTGLDLRQLFIGSEGTLGVITQATLKLCRLPGKADVFMFAVPDVPGVLKLFNRARGGPFTINAYEFFTDKCLARVQKHRGLRAPFAQSSGCYVLLEAEAADATALETWLGEVMGDGLVTDGILAQSSTQAAELWALRESISESLSGTGLPHKNDVALPIAALEGFIAEFNNVFENRYPGWEIAVFGHIGDGNLHINVMKPDAMEKTEFLNRTHDADHEMFELVARHHGSISAEHGIGLLKKAYLRYSRTPHEVAIQRAVKMSLDPNTILNPGKIFDV